MHRGWSVPTALQKKYSNKYRTCHESQKLHWVPSHCKIPINSTAPNPCPPEKRTSLRCTASLSVTALSFPLLMLLQSQGFLPSQFRVSVVFSPVKNMLETVLFPRDCPFLVNSSTQLNGCTLLWRPPSKRLSDTPLQQTAQQTAQ